MATQVTLNSGSVDSAGSLLLKTNGTTTAVTIDTSQNMGLGVTPSAWASTFRAMQVGSRSAFYQDSGSATALANNIYNDGSNKYIASAAATIFLQEAGAFKFFNAASGTAGNAITFTQAMTLNASGQLGIGNTNFVSSNLLETESNMTLRNTASYSTSLSRSITYWSSTQSFGNQPIANINFLTTGPINSAITFNTRSSAADYAERARIDSSGNLLVGTASAWSASVHLQVKAASGAAVASFEQVSSSGDNIYIRNTNGVVGSITTSGSSTAYNTSSDYRLKENIAPMTGALAKIAQLKPVTYTWKADGSAGEGFIAHELQAVVPDAVVGEKDAVDEEGNPKYQGIDTSFLVATLTAAIQEQQQIITALTARIEALEQA